MIATMVATLYSLSRVYFLVSNVCFHSSLSNIRTVSSLLPLLYCLYDADMQRNATMLSLSSTIGIAPAQCGESLAAPAPLAFGQSVPSHASMQNTPVRHTDAAATEMTKQMPRSCPRASS